jgi:hypothetical protein
MQRLIIYQNEEFLHKPSLNILMQRIMLYRNKSEVIFKFLKSGQFPYTILKSVNLYLIQLDLKPNLEEKVRHEMARNFVYEGGGEGEIWAGTKFRFPGRSVIRLKVARNHWYWEVAIFSTSGFSPSFSPSSRLAPNLSSSEFKKL